MIKFIFWYAVQNTILKGKKKQLYFIINKLCKKICQEEDKSKFVWLWIIMTELDNNFVYEAFSVHGSLFL